MKRVMTTKLSSKGQVVLPEALRQMYGWDNGTAFAVFAYKGSVIMQPIKAPSDDELSDEFEEVFAQARRQARDAGMTPSDISSVIEDVRRERSARRPRR